MNDIRQQRGTWVFLVPISNLKLTETVNFEFRIDRVTFISSDKLPRRRKRFGLPQRISELRDKRKGIIIEELFDSTSCFATLRRQGKLSDFEDAVFDLIREELSILALSQLGYAKRRSISFPSISKENPISSRSYYVTNADKGSWSQSNRIVGNIRSLSLNTTWHKFQQKVFFYELLKIIRGEIKVAKHWRRDIRNAAVLVGQSQVSRDLPQAFLWNMIALELLLTEQGDTYTEALPNRVEAFLGWIGFWKVEGFEERIREVYKKRSAFVHAGMRDLITRDDLFFTDDLLLNIFLNIVGHHHLFNTKSSVIEFSKRVQAEHLLSINAKVRPKTLQYMRRTYSEDDYKD